MKRDQPATTASSSSALQLVVGVEQGQWAVLGGARFVLAMIVASTHVARFTPEGLWTSLAELSGLAAVLGFLIISGYSIAHSITTKPNGYYWRRVVRIMPLYALAIAAAYAIGWLPNYNSSPSAAGFPPPTLYLSVQNLFFGQLVTGRYVGTNGPVWTLAIEVVFYALAPLFVRLPHRMLLGMITCSGVAFIVHERWHLTYYSLCGSGLNLLLLGWPWLFGFWFYLNKGRSSAETLLLVAPLATCSLCYGGYLSPMWPLTILGVSVALLFAEKVQLPTSLRTVLSHLGDISYPLYLFHVPAMIVASNTLGSGSAPQLLLIACALAWIADIAFDKPLRQLLARPANAHPKRRRIEVAGESYGTIARAFGQS